MMHRPLYTLDLRIVREVAQFASERLCEAEKAAARAWRDAGYRTPRPLLVVDLMRAALFGAVEQIVDTCARALDNGEGPDLRVVPRDEGPDDDPDGGERAPIPADGAA